MSCFSDFQITETLYSTETTYVYRALRESDQSSVILRTGAGEPNASQCARLNASAEILRSFDHPNITKVVDVFDEDGQPCLVMEDTKSIDLNQYLQSV